jgi:prevent-host-death family protein
VIQQVNASAARQQWRELLNKVFRRETRVIVEKSGIPVAALIPIPDLKRFQRFEQERAARFQVLVEIGAAFNDVPLPELTTEDPVRSRQHGTRRRSYEGNA